jgi:phage shock protein C
MERKIFRSRKNRMFLGVCGGMGAYYHIDPVMIRVILVLVTVASGFGPGIIAYFILAMIIPLEGSKAGTTQDTFKENLADLETSSRHLGSQFKNARSNQSPLTPDSPEPLEPTLSFAPPTRSNRGLYVFAILLVCVGILILIIKNVPHIWSFLWPMTLVIAGIIIITLVLARKRES